MLVLRLFAALFGTLAFVWSKSPNVVFFLTDDWGFNDVGYHLNTDTETPFINSIALEESIIIEKYYALPLCTMTRAALLTGRYVMRYGLQSQVLSYTSNYALTRKETLLSNEFHNNGYSTHMIGKWHLGFLTWDYTPNFRGFDSFVGYYGAALYYYTHYGAEGADDYTAYDMHWDMNDYNQARRYSLDIWSEHASFVIRDQGLKYKSSNTPFFLYMAWQGSHDPSESSQYYYDLYANNLTEPEKSSNNARINFQAQTTNTDDAFRLLVTELKMTGLWDNTIVVFASDNGAEVGYGDNSPLRGGKWTLWEGGVRLAAFVTGGFIPNQLKGKIFDEYPIHVTDWYPSLLHACGLKITRNNPQTLDGENIWNLLMTANKDSTQYFNVRRNAMINGNYQETIVGTTDDEVNAKRISQFDKISQLYEYSDDEQEEEDSDKMAQLLSLTERRKMLLNVDNDNCGNDICGGLIYGGRWKLLYSHNQADTKCGWERTFEISTQDVLGCGSVPQDVNASSCVCDDQVCLFDLIKDPCEYYDVSDEHPLLTKQLYQYLEEYYNAQTGALTSVIGDTSDKNVYPLSTDGSIPWWVPWENTSDWQSLLFEEYLDTYYQGSWDKPLPRNDSSEENDLRIDENYHAQMGSNSLFRNILNGFHYYYDNNNDDDINGNDATMFGNMAINIGLFGLLCCMVGICVSMKELCHNFNLKFAKNENVIWTKNASEYYDHIELGKHENLAKTITRQRNFVAIDTIQDEMMIPINQETYMDDD